MTWNVDATPLNPGRGSVIVHLLRAELRQFWWLSPAVLAAGLGVVALLAAVTSRVPTDARPEGVVFNNVGSLVLSVFPLLLATPLVAGLGSTNRLGLWLGLPVDRRTVNLVRILGVATNIWPAILTWPLIVALLSRVYGPVVPWVLVNSALFVGIGILLATRTVVAPFATLILLPIQGALSHFIPGGRPLGDAMAHGMASPWVAVVLGGGLAFLLVHVLKSPPPRKG